MNQQRVEAVQVAACLVEAFVYAPDLFVALEERRAERVEEVDEGQLDLRVRVVKRGVEGLLPSVGDERGAAL